MAQDPQVNFYDVVAEAEAYFDTIDIHAKGSGWKGYQRWLWENEKKYYPTGDRSQIDPYFAENAYKEFVENTPESNIFNAGWEQLGPHYIGQVTGHYSLGLGRVECFYGDPNDPDRIYLGSRSGGFWQTLDGGATWNEGATDFLIGTGVNTMTVRPTNPDSILINVRNARNGTTHGIYRSTDAGLTWTETAFNPTNLGWGGMGTNRQIYEVIYHPTIPDLVYVATNEGFYRSTDDMATWSQILTATTYEVHFHPTDPNVMYVRRNNSNYLYVSTDAGLSFSNSGTTPGGNISRLSTSGDCPDCIYAVNGDYVWMSDNQGATFSEIANHGLGMYGAFAVSDVDSSQILVGNIDINMSADGGQSFNQTTFWSQGNASYATNSSYVHADIRRARCYNGVFWVGTDGFLARSYDNGITWEIFEGQSIRENYSLGVSQSQHGRTITGSQDNGTSINTENGWVEFYGADGMEGIIHPLNDDWMIGSLQYGGRRLTKDGGSTQTGATPPGQNGGWVAPLVYDPNNHMTVYSFGDTVFRSVDFGESWTQLGTPSFGGTISHAVISEGNSQKMVVSRGQDIEISFNGGNIFFDIQGSLPNSSIADICFDPNDDNTLVVVYASYQNNGEKVYISNNNGVTWTNITANLGNIPVRSVVIDHTDASTIYVGTEIGVFKKAMADNTWSLYNPDLPNVSISEMEIMYGSNTLRAITWGRGLWEYTLDGRVDHPAILTTDITDAPTAILPLEGDDQFVTSVISYDGTLSNAYVEWSLNTPVFGNVIPMTNTIDSTWVSDQPLPNAAAGTKVFFKVYAVGSTGDTSETYKFMYTLKPEQYCPSTGNMSWQTAVTLVDFNTINNPTGKTQPYTDYTATHSTTVEVGSAYALTTNVNTDGNYTIYAKAWIDWNHDFDFNDPGEEYDMGSAQNTANGPTNASPMVVTVPANAYIGTTTMRVSAKYNQSPDTCETGFDGEVEDYSIEIIPNCPPLSSTMDITACDSYNWNGSTYTATGSYSVNLVNAQGCDSTANLNLTIETVNTNVTQGGIVLTAQSASGTFQWIDCDNGNAAISGATNPSYVATANGNYAVIVTTGSCSDTSACFVVDQVGLNENTLEQIAVVAPNPSDGHFSINFNEAQESVAITVYDAAGKLILTDNRKNEKSLAYTLDVAPGTYYLQVQLAEKAGVFTLLVE
ncbi:MAG: T9SS type A sorting domain-containing protein [Crocinitomicaceae bacterium]